MKQSDVKCSIPALFLFLVLMTALSALNTQIFAQNTDEEIRAALEKVDHGQSEEVKKILPDLVSKYQNTPGVIYLQGRLASDGIEAVKFYQGVVDNFPKSDWADDALYRIYQYYYSLGLYRTADLKMQQLKKEYPNSQYVTGKVELRTPPVEEKPVKLPQKEIVVESQPDTQQAGKQPANQEEPKIEQPAPKNEPYTVQIGAYSTVANAGKQKKYFDDLGYKVEVVNKIRNGRSLFLVWVGSFKSVDEARQMVREIKLKYKIESMIVERY